MVFAKEKGKRASLAVRSDQEMVLNRERLQRTDRVETQFRKGSEMSDRESGSLSSVGPRQPPSLAFCCCWKVTTDVVASNNKNPCDYLGASRIIKLFMQSRLQYPFSEVVCLY